MKTKKTLAAAAEIGLQTLLFCVVEHALVFMSYRFYRHPLYILFFAAGITVLQRYCSFLESRHLRKWLSICIGFLVFALVLGIFGFSL